MPLSHHSETGDSSSKINLTGQVKRTTKYPAAAGPCATLCLGQWFNMRHEFPPCAVVIKTLRIPRSSNVDAEALEDDLRERLCRSWETWKTLDHVNIITFHGYLTEPDIYSPRTTSLVSRWFANGNVKQYLALHSEADRWALCLDIASGLQYLHTREPPVVHGNLKAKNILIGSDGRAVLSDVGLSMILDDLLGNLTTSYRYLSPESIFDGLNKSIQSDIWAFACTCIEVLFDQHPYSQCKSPASLYRAMYEGFLPFIFEIESVNRSGPIPVQYKTFLQGCWARVPGARPAIALLPS